MAHTHSIDDLIHLFSYHKPFGDQAERYESMRSAARTFAMAILSYCPDSPERTLAIRDLQRCVMMANASIALNERPPT